MILEKTPLKFHKCTPDEIIKFGKVAEIPVKPLDSATYNCLDKSQNISLRGNIDEVNLAYIRVKFNECNKTQRKDCMDIDFKNFSANANTYLFSVYWSFQ